MKSKHFFVIKSSLAKIILTGEHAVMYKNKAISRSIPLKLAIYVKKNVIHKKLFNTKNKENVYFKLNLSTTIEYNTIISNIPKSAGLGSSASLSCSIAKLILFFLYNRIHKKILIFQHKKRKICIKSEKMQRIRCRFFNKIEFNSDIVTYTKKYLKNDYLVKNILETYNIYNNAKIEIDDFINKLFNKQLMLRYLSYHIEKNFHGTPSGLDTTTICENKMISYVDLNNYSVINEKLNLICCIINVGEREISTKNAIKNLHNPQNFDIFQEINAISNALEIAIMNHNVHDIFDLINQNGEKLSLLGCETAKTRHAVQLLKKFGAGAAKISGAGFGGIVFGLFENKKNNPKLGQLMKTFKNSRNVFFFNI